MYSKNCLHSWHLQSFHDEFLLIRVICPVPHYEALSKATWLPWQLFWDKSFHIQHSLVSFTLPDQVTWTMIQASSSLKHSQLSVGKALIMSMGRSQKGFWPQTCSVFLCRWNDTSVLHSTSSTSLCATLTIHVPFWAYLSHPQFQEYGFTFLWP